MPGLSLQSCKAGRNREHVETFSPAPPWSGSIRMTLYYMPGWIMEALVGEQFNWCMNMQLCLIPGPEINQSSGRSGAILRFCHLHSRNMWLFVMLGCISPSPRSWKTVFGPLQFCVLPPLRVDHTTQILCSFSCFTRRAKLQACWFCSGCFNTGGPTKWQLNKLRVVHLFLFFKANLIMYDSPFCFLDYSKLPSIHSFK